MTWPRSILAIFWLTAMTATGTETAMHPFVMDWRDNADALVDMSNSARRSGRQRGTYSHQGRSPDQAGRHAISYLGRQRHRGGLLPD